MCKQPYDGKYWDSVRGICSRHVNFTIYHRWSFCLLCKISELENQRNCAHEEIGLLQGQLEAHKDPKQ